MINPDTGNRIRMITQDAETGKELERRDLVKGYEFQKNQYLLLNDEDLNSVKVESLAVMTVEKFVDADFDRSGLLRRLPITWRPTATPAAIFMPSCGKRSPKPARWRCRASSSHSGSGPLPSVPPTAASMAHTLYEERDLN